MVYQNNNNRVNPDAVVDARITPVATPTNQEIRYRDSSQDKAKQTAAMAEGLASLGQGVIALSPVMQRRAAAAVEKGKQEAEINKNDWEVVSRNIPTLSKFNPYLKDTYQQLQFQDIKNAAISEFNGIQDKYAMDETEYLKQRSAVYQKMMQAANKQGIKYQNYSGQLIDFDNTMQKLDAQYYTQHAEYMQNKVWKKIAFNLSQKILLDLPNSKDKVADMKLMLDEFNAGMTANGASDETIAKTMLTSLAGDIIDNPELLDAKTVRAALTGLKINGRDLGEIDNTFITNVNKLCKDAITAKYAEDEARWRYESAQASHDMHIALGEYYEWEQQNPKATPDEKLSKAKELCSNYNLQTYAGEWFGTTNSLENVITNMSKVRSDPYVADNLNIKSLRGELTEEELNRNLPYLSRDDYTTFYNRVEKNLTANQSTLEKQAKDWFLASKPLLPLDKDDRAKFVNEYTALQKKLENKEIDKVQYNQELREMLTGAKYASEIKTNQRRNVNIILNGDYRRSNKKRINPEDINTISKELSKMGILRNKQGVPLQKVEIADPYSQARPLNGKAHYGIDVKGVTAGQPVYCPYGVGGQLVAKGFEKSMGYYAVVRQGNQYMLVMHLIGLPKHNIGGFITSNSAIGYVGNTGNTYNGAYCLHIEFWNSRLEWENITDFKKFFNSSVGNRGMK